MNIEHLIQMANQIGQYFNADPDRESARAGVAEHLTRFWEKRMRQQIYVHLDNDMDKQIMPLVAEALQQHRDRILGISK